MAPAPADLPVPQAGQPLAQAPQEAPPRPQVGDRLFVCLDALVSRPLIVTMVTLLNLETDPAAPARVSLRVSGVLFCEPEDHATRAIRTLGTGTRDPARIHGRPERLAPYAYGELLEEGTGYGQWRRTL